MNFAAVGGREVSEDRRSGLGRSGRFHQGGERHALAEPPEPDPAVRDRPDAAHEDGERRSAERQPDPWRFLFSSSAVSGCR